jgi:hypothetical protein
VFTAGFSEVNPRGLLVVSFQEGGIETAPEILLQAGGKLTHFVSGFGTVGTITGVGRRMMKGLPSVEIVQIVPEDFPGIEGLKPADFVIRKIEEHNKGRVLFEAPDGTTTPLAGEEMEFLGLGVNGVKRVVSKQDGRFTVGGILDGNGVR